MLYLSVGMPRAGSGWFYNLTQDLLVAAGATPATEIRNRYFLKPFLTEVNCNIGTLSPQRLLPVMVPSILGKSYLIKLHGRPRMLATQLIRHQVIKAMYIYRDPRDALLSAYDYGRRILEQTGRPNAFSHLDTIDKAIEFIADYVKISEEWLQIEQVFSVRYESLKSDYQQQVLRLCEFLQIDERSPAILTVIEKYRPEQGEAGRKGLHFYKGQVGRFRQVLSPAQQQRCLDIFGDYLRHMGYPE